MEGECGLEEAECEWGCIRILFTLSLFEAADRRVPCPQATHIGPLRCWLIQSLIDWSFTISVK